MGLEAARAAAAVALYRDVAKVRGSELALQECSWSISHNTSRPMLAEEVGDDSG